MIPKGLVSKGKEIFLEKSGISQAIKIVKTGKESTSLEKSKTSKESEKPTDDGFDEKDYLCHGRILSALSVMEQAYEFQNLFYDLGRKGME